MGKRLLGAIVSAAVTAMVIGGSARSAWAAPVSFPRLARGMSTWLVRAMDPCSPATVSVVGSNLPPGGCIQANAVTDSLLKMNFVKMRVNQRGRIGLFGTGFTLGDVLRVRLTLRVTKLNTNISHPARTRNVTFTDQTIDCPKSPDAFAVRPNGAVVGSTDLGACFNPNINLGRGNIEIIDASLINIANADKVVARPGVLH